MAGNALSPLQSPPPSCNNFLYGSCGHTFSIQTALSLGSTAPEPFKCGACGRALTYMLYRPDVVAWSGKLMYDTTEDVPDWFAMLSAYNEKFGLGRDGVVESARQALFWMWFLPLRSKLIVLAFCVMAALYLVTTDRAFRDKLGAFIYVEYAVVVSVCLAVCVHVPRRYVACTLRRMVSKTIFSSTHLTV